MVFRRERCYRMKNKHQHVFISGWIRGRQLYRECISCRQTYRWYETNKIPDIIKSDYDYYKEMANQLDERR
jgi:dissimilatory sulfite reductase (desulfoviridin) alpha/beta subunit